MNEHEAVVRFAYEVGHLSRCPRAGWQMAGIVAPESVAEHSHRTGILAYLIATLEGANPERAATLGLFHDVPETRTTDLHSMAKEYVEAVRPESVAADQTAEMPFALRRNIGAIIAEVEQKTSPESLASRDADKLDCLLRAREYQEQQGNSQVQPFVDNMLKGMRTDTGMMLAETATELSPRAWWFDVASAYGLPAMSR